MLSFDSGAVELNSLTVYFFQGDKKEAEPSDTTKFTYDGATHFEVKILNEARTWATVATVTHNLLARRIINFPTQRVVALGVWVLYTNGKHTDQRIYPAVTEMEVFKL
jgi:hypothetical protein